jgi:hypothetical protein
MLGSGLETIPIPRKQSSNLVRTWTSRDFTLSIDTELWASRRCPRTGLAKIYWANLGRIQKSGVCRRVQPKTTYYSSPAAVVGMRLDGHPLVDRLAKMPTSRHQLNFKFE